MSNPETLGNPEEEQVLSGEAIIDIVWSSDNLRQLSHIVVQDEFDAAEAQSSRGVRLMGHVEGSEKPRWATLRLNHDEDGMVALFSTTYPRVKNYEIPEIGTVRASDPYANKRKVRFYDRIILTNRLSGLKVYHPEQ